MASNPIDDEIKDKASSTALSRVRKIFDDSGLTLERIARELSTIALSRIDDYVTVAQGGEIQAIPFDQIPKDRIPAIRKLKERTRITESADGKSLTKDSRLEYELWDKLDALRYAAKLRGDEVQRVDISDHRMVQALLDSLPADMQEGVLEAMRVLLKEKKG